jgi:Uncharacterized phage-associated protein
MVSSGKYHSELPVDARDVANYILDVADRNNAPITNLALQKILFFCHAIFLIQCRSPLIHNPIEAWRMGPVVRSVYDAFRCFGREPITARAVHSDPLDERVFVVPFSPSERVREVLEPIITSYAQMNPMGLVYLSHVHGGPWHAALEDYVTKANVGLRIDDETIIARFCKPKSEVVHMI